MIITLTDFHFVQIPIGNYLSADCARFLMRTNTISIVKIALNFLARPKTLLRGEENKKERRVGKTQRSVAKEN